MRISKTQKRILDAAEVLFARNGFHATSVRDITGSAGITLAAVNYHFGTKECLYEKVFERGLATLTRSCREKLTAIWDEAAGEGGLPKEEEVLRAILEPMLCSKDSRQVSPGFYSLLGRAMMSPQPSREERYLEPLFGLFFENLGKIRPTLPENILAWRLRFAFGAIGHALCGAATELTFFLGIDPFGYSEELLRVLIAFLAAGIKAPTEGPLPEISAEGAGRCEGCPDPNPGSIPVEENSFVND